jgi:murein DD-endopeptidase MepM/ murein hydrolase activator NlpD
MWNGLFRDHEIYVRTGGEVRFLHLGARLQRRVAMLVLAVLGAWLMGTAALLGWQAWTSWKTRGMADRAAAIALAEARVTAERRSVEEIARSIDSRQDELEALVGAQFGETAANGETRAPIPAPSTPASSVPASSAVAPSAAASDLQPTSADAAGNQIARLKAAAVRQERLVAHLAGAVDQRSAEVEQVLLQVGIRPSLVSARGGPFIPWPARSAAKAEALKPVDPAIRQLALKFDRMRQLESLLEAVPSGLPADRMELSSGFGYRYDPFNGQRAIHAGLDFTGPYGSPIRAAAAGRVSFAGLKNGYGNVIEVDHGHGIETRYAHLSGFTARVGDIVESGAQIGRMGSTGRSTGTHLHFEVRVGGTAVNPRRFLEANPDVLEVKADADSRRDTGGRARVVVG